MNEWMKQCAKHKQYQYFFRCCADLFSLWLWCFIAFNKFIYHILIDLKKQNNIISFLLSFFRCQTLIDDFQQIRVFYCGSNTFFISKLFINWKFQKRFRHNTIQFSHILSISIFYLHLRSHEHREWFAQKFWTGLAAIATVSLWLPTRSM